MAAATPTPNLRSSPYANGLDKNPANYVALSPLSFIERTASVYPHYPAVIHGNIRRDWAQTYQRCRRLASALAGRGIRGEVTGRALALGNQRLFDELQLDSPLRQQATAWEAEGRTLSWLIEQGQPARVLGLLAFGDSLKAGAAAAVAALRDQGIESHLISGDNAGSAHPPFMREVTDPLTAITQSQAFKLRASEALGNDTLTIYERA